MKSEELFELAAKFDRSIKLPYAKSKAAIQRKEIRPERYSRSRLFTRMAAAEVGLFRGVPTGPRRPTTATDIAERVSTAFERRTRANVRIGSGRTPSRITVDRLIRRWLDDRFLTSTTDLHFRATSLTRWLRVKGISDYNLLAAPNQDWMEMMTLVASTTGSVTESHSDDCDGSNHSVVGRKLWLIWDRLEGKAHGLEDVTYDSIYRDARFDFETYLRLKSSLWFVVSPGVTLFLPGHYTHRVITLERYFGFGSFYIGLPCWLRTFARWRTTGASYVTTSVLERIIGRVIRRTRRIATSREAMDRYGWKYAVETVGGASRNNRRIVEDPAWRAFVDLLK